MNLTDEQSAAVAASGTIQVLSAGAGSGKTRTLVSKVIAEQKSGLVEPSKQVVVTFTNAAADEFRRRLEEQGAVMPWHVGTLHSFALRWVRNGARVIGDREFDTLVRQALLNASVKGISIKAAKTFAAGDGSGIIGKNRVARAAVVSLLKKLDVIHPDMILGNFKGRMREFNLPTGLHLYVDEFQDSAPIDSKIYLELVEELQATLFAVGDPRQSIFGFRGGSISEFFDLWKRADWKGQLSANYRSNPVIVYKANEIAERMSFPEGLSPHMDPVRGVNHGQPVEELQVNEVTFETCEAEAERIAKVAIMHREQGTCEDLAILCRYNLSVQLIADVLRAHAIEVNSSQDRAEAAEFLQDDETARRVMALESIPSDWESALIQLDAPKVTRDKLLPILRECHDVESIPVAIREGILRPAANAVTVSTIHAAKGLEWPHVWLAGADAKSFDPKEAESVRLAYVAVTRAEQTLTVSSAGSRQSFRREINLEPSPVLFG